MESGRDVVIFIHILGWFMCMTPTLLPVHVAGLEDVEQQQVYMKSELPNNLVISNKRTFKILKQSQLCSYSDLKTCHSNENNHDTYYERCYSDVCSFENYFCLNVHNKNSIHLCGKTYPWSKRYRTIAVLDLAVSGHIDVYRTACPDGYFQENRRNAFTPCVKDESIIIVRNTTNQVPALLRCNTQKNYCNSHGAILFELASDDDSCVDAKYDLKIKCSPTEELMPNCICAPNCRTGEERIWNGSNICRLIGERKDTDQVPSHVTVVTKPYKPSSQRTTHQTNQLLNKNRTSEEEDLSVKDTDRQNTDTVKNNYTAMTIGLVAAVVIILAVVVVALALRFIGKHRQITGGYRNYNTALQRNSLDEHSEQLSLGSEHEDTREVQGNILSDVQQEPEAVDLEAASGDTNVIHRNSISSEPLMQYLKENDEMQSDSGIYSASQTYVKTVA
ncbi:uncharacterized protein LOC128551499 isoform X2 [Mercenaria mercenaria]|nr:uncharacterized protein LOC128551499 isoform X2 [Mercenaria mercenaria]